MNYLDLFAGIGGFHEGLRQAGYEFSWAGYSEIDKYAKQIYQKHFLESEDLGDVRAITLDKLPRGKLILTGGFPCQDLSVAGKHAGIAGTRSGLFFEIIRILSEWQPDIFILENVLGLLTSYGRRDFETIIREIANIGVYYTEWQVLNSIQFLPQNRKRVFVVGRHNRNGCPEAIFPIRKSYQCSQDAGEKRLPEDGKEIAHALTASYGNGVSRGSRTMIKVKVGTTKDDHYRKLTPVECERLQGFPDGWTEGVSDTQRYKCIGNAVSIPIIRMIAEKLMSNQRN